MSDKPENPVDPGGETASAGLPAEEDAEQPAGFPWPRSLAPAATRRALLLTALGALLIAGLVTAIPSVGAKSGRFAGYSDNNPVPSTGAKSNPAFSRATRGSCLMWPDGAPDSMATVNCADDHRFEVAESVDLRAFPGSEYGPTAAPPSPARIQQITQEQCEAAVRNYLGPKFDPNSKFIVSLLWSGERAWRQSGDRRILCGLQLPGANNQQVAYKGKVADIDQSKVWPTGTCLSIDLATNQPIDVAVDCAAPHAMEVTGTVNLAEKFPNALPAEPEQDGFIKDACTKMTDAYLAPVKLRTTTLTLIYPTVSMPSWSAGSRAVACSIGATLGNGGWATLVNSAKGALIINGQAPVPPPDIPEERLALPPVAPQMPVPQQQPSAPTQATPPDNQHLPGQPVSPSEAPHAPQVPQQPQAPQAPQAPPPAEAPPPEGPPPGGAAEPAPGN